MSDGGPLSRGAPNWPLAHTPVVGNSSTFCHEDLDNVNTRRQGFEGELGLGVPHIGEVAQTQESNQIDTDPGEWNSSLRVNVSGRIAEPVVQEGSQWACRSPLGTIVNVYQSCIESCCTCKYFIGDVLCQLKPCRFAAILHQGGGWSSEYWDLLWCITDGFPIVEGDVPKYHCKNYNSILENDCKSKMDKIITRELGEGMVSEASEFPHCIHSLGAVPKQDGGIRPITDCSRPLHESVNNFCGSLFKEFSYKSVDNVVELLTWGNHMSVIDIKSAYRAVPIMEQHRKYMGFQWEVNGVLKTFVDNRMCFGLRLGPQYFQRISNFIHDVLLYEHGVVTVNYLDDFIVVCKSYDACLKAQGAVLDVLRSLGFHVAYDKVTPPSTCTTYLGVEIDSVTMELRLPQSKLLRLRDLLETYVTRKKISKKDLESLGGLLSHCSHLVRGGRTFCRRIFNLYKEICVKNLKVISMSPEVRSDLNWWRVFCVSFNGVSQINNVEYQLPMVSDSSMKGFGVYLGEDWVAGTWSEDSLLVLDSPCNHIGSSPVTERNFVDFKNINVLELWPIVVGIKRWTTVLSNKTVVLLTDNTQVMHMLINDSSTNAICMSWIREIYWVCVFNNIELKPKYINTHDNVVADTLSRLQYFRCGIDVMDLIGDSNLCCFSDLLANYRDGRVEPKEEGS